MLISVAVTLFTALVLLDPVEEVQADSSRLVIHTPQKINFIHRYHTSEHYAKDYGYGTHHNHHHVHHKPKKVVHHHRNRGGRWRGRKRYVWRKVGARTPYAGGKSYGMSNYAVDYRNWVPTSKRRNRPRGSRPRDPPRHRESYLQPPRDYSDYDSFAAHWEEDPSSSESNEIADYPSASLNSGSYRRPDHYDAGYDPLDDDPGVVPAWQDSSAYGSQDSSEVGTYNVHDLDDLRGEPSRGISSNFRVSYAVNDRDSDNVQGYSTLPDELVSQFSSASVQRPPKRQQVSEWQNDRDSAHRERGRPLRQPQHHNFRNTGIHQDQSFGTSNTQHRHQPPPSNILRKPNLAVTQKRPHRDSGSINIDHMTTPRNRPPEEDVYRQAFQSFSYRKQQQRQKQHTKPQRSQTEQSMSHGGMHRNQWEQGEPSASHSGMHSNQWEQSEPSTSHSGMHSNQWTRNEPSTNHGGMHSNQWEQSEPSASHSGMHSNHWTRDEPSTNHGGMHSNQWTRNEPSTNHGGMHSNQWTQNTRGDSTSSATRTVVSAPHLQYWPQEPKDTGSDHDIGYGEGLEDLNDQFRF